MNLLLQGLSLFLAGYTLAATSASPLLRLHLMQLHKRSN